MSKPNIRIGVSSCLLGEMVRYDGNHRRNSYVTETLAEHFELISVCPESELGMGIPRETVDLEGDVAAPSMIGTHTRKDWTQAMNNWAQMRIQELAPLGLCGFVMKKGSPSCGVFRVPVIQDNREPLPEGRGLFAMAFMDANPEIPVEDELRLEDPAVRAEFLEKVFALHQSRQE